MAEEKEVKLLYMFPSPSSLRVVLVLEIKGISYEIIPDDIFNKSQLLLESNPLYKKLPVLLHKNQAICDSRNIIQYLDEAFPHTPAILPGDPLSRARERFLAEFIEDKILGTAFSINLNLGAKHEDLVRNCELLEEEFRKHECKPFFAGDKLGFVDVVLAAPAIWALDLIPSEESCPNLHKLMAAIRDHPLVKSVLPEPEALKKILIQAAPKFSQFYGGKS